MALGGGTFVNTNKKLPGSYINQKTKDIIAGLKAKIASLNNEMSDGKALIAGTITSCGVPTESDASFQMMADNILSIPAGDADNLFGYLTGNYTDIDNYDITQLGFVDLGITDTLDLLRNQLIRAGVNVTDLEDDSFYILPAVTGSTIGWSFQAKSNGRFNIKYANGSHTDNCTYKEFPIHLYVKKFPDGGLLIGNPYNDTTNAGILGFFGALSAYELQNSKDGFYMFPAIFPPNGIFASNTRIFASSSPTSGGYNNILSHSVQVYTDEYLCIVPAISNNSYGSANCMLNNLSVPYCSKNYFEGDASNGYIFTDDSGNVFWLPAKGTVSTDSSTRKVCIRLSD